MSAYHFISIPVRHKSDDPRAGYYVSAYGRRLIHIVRWRNSRRSGLFYSGYMASGDNYMGDGPHHPRRVFHPYLAVVDVGSDHTGPADDDKVYVPRVSLTDGFDAGSLVIAARAGMWGFQLVEEGGHRVRDIETAVGADRPPA